MKKSIVLPCLLMIVIFMISCTRQGTVEESTAVPTTSQVSTEVVTTQETTTEARVIIEETHAEEDIQYYRGRRSEGVYTNDVFNIKFDAPANGYKMLSRDDIAKMREIFLEQTNKNSPDRQIQDDDIYLDIYAISADGKGVSNVNVVIQRMSTSFENETDLKKVAQILQEQFKASGLTNVTVESDKAMFKGKETIGISAVDTSGDYTVYRKQIYIKSGDFMAIITSSSDSEEKAQKVLDLFTTVNDTEAQTTTLEETTAAKEAKTSSDTTEASETTKASEGITAEETESIKND